MFDGTVLFCEHTMKDPSFLFYPSDFLTGTMFMSNEEIGIYIKLLCAQHQLGGMIEKAAFNSLVKDNSIIRTKFIETEEGFFNKRLMVEMEKRSIKSSNLSANAKLRWEKEKQKECKSNAIASDLDMPTINRDININVNEYMNAVKDVIKESKKKFVKPTIQEISDYSKSINFNLDSEYWFDYYETRGWMLKGSKMKDWKAAVRTWKKNNFNKNTNNIQNEPQKSYAPTSEFMQKILDGTADAK